MSTKHTSSHDIGVKFDEITVDLNSCTVKISNNDLEIIPDESDTTHTVKWNTSFDGDLLIRNPYGLNPFAKGEVLLMLWCLVELNLAPGLGVAVDELDKNTGYLLIDNMDKIAMLAASLDQIEDNKN